MQTKIRIAPGKGCRFREWVVIIVSLKVEKPHSPRYGKKFGIYSLVVWVNFVWFGSIFHSSRLGSSRSRLDLPRKFQ